MSVSISVLVICQLREIKKVFKYMPAFLISEMPEASFVPTTVIKSTFDGAD